MNFVKEKLKSFLRAKVGSERYLHSLCVADEARKLAKRYVEDENKAYVAGLLHDITKEFTEKDHFKLIKKYDVKLDEIELRTEKLWHAITAPLYVKEELKIEDEDILKAIRYHTTGRANMGKLEEIIFLADFISEDRKKEFKNVEEARDVAYKNLEEGVLYELRCSIKSLVKKESPISLESVKAYYYYLLLGKEIEMKD